MMKILKLAIAASVALGAAGAAQAQDWRHDGGRRGYEGRGDEGRRDWHGDRHRDREWRGREWHHRGWGYARHCRIVWRHHVRHRLCWR
jgi:hypothetical protein